MPACARSTSAIPIIPKEVGYFIPVDHEATDKRCVKVDGKDRCKVAIQTNNVETDERGYIYVVDRANTGLHILELTGAARAGGPRVPLRRALCGERVEIYVRPKIGFCNCDSGVADDDEVDRVADLDLISERFAAELNRAPDPVADMPAGSGPTISDARRLAACRRRHRRVAALRSAGRGGAGQRHRVRRSAPSRSNFSLKKTTSRWMTARWMGSLRSAGSEFPSTPFYPRRFRVRRGRPG
jgi:hypothetical protein